MAHTLPNGSMEEVDDDLPENIPPLIVGITLVYCGVLIVAGLWCYLGKIALLPSLSPDIYMQQLGWSVVVGLILVVSTSLVQKHTRIFGNIEHAVRQRLGELSRIGVVSLSLLSSIAEELLFRGAIQTSITEVSGSQILALITTSILFGALHMGRDKSFLPWTIFAVGSGFVLGYSYMVTGNILVPITIHFLINCVNMWRIIFRKEP